DTAKSRGFINEPGQRLPECNRAARLFGMCRLLVLEVCQDARTKPEGLSSSEAEEWGPFYSLSRNQRLSIFSSSNAIRPCKQVYTLSRMGPGWESAGVWDLSARRYFS